MKYCQKEKKRGSAPSLFFPRLAPLNTHSLLDHIEDKKIRHKRPMPLWSIV